MLSYKKKYYLISALIFLFLLGSLAVAFVLQKSNQDTRQQASTACQAGDPYCNPAAPDANKTENKGILQTSYTGQRPQTQSSCNGVWMNNFCYMPGDELAGGYIVVNSGRYNYPYLEQKKTYESLSFGGEVIKNQVGSVEKLGENCGGNSFRIGNNCYAFGSVVNGYVVMPNRSSNCDNSTGNYCYAHLKKIEVQFDTWQNAVASYQNEGNLQALEKLYKQTYGVDFKVGNLYNEQAANAKLLKAQALLAALTSPEVLQKKAQAENQALQNKAQSAALSQEEQAVFDFNQRIIDYPDLAAHYQVLDQLNSATASKITVNTAISQMYANLIGAKENSNLEQTASNKFKEIFGYDPSVKYNNLDGILEAFGIDPKKFQQDRQQFLAQSAAQQPSAADQQKAANTPSDKIATLNKAYQDYASGKSTDLNKLKKAAIEAGIVDAEEAKRLVAKDLLALILEQASGFDSVQARKDAEAVLNQRSSSLISNIKIATLNKEYQDYASGASTDLNKLKKAAIDAGIVDAEEAKRLVAKDLLALILEQTPDTNSAQAQKNAEDLLAQRSFLVQEQQLVNKVSSGQVNTNDLEALYQFYVKSQPALGTTDLELKKELAKYNPQLALIFYEQNRDVTYLNNYYLQNKKPTNLAQINLLGDERALLKNIYGSEGENFYLQIVIPKRFDQAIDNFSKDAGQGLTQLCQDLKVTICQKENFSDSKQATTTLALMLDKIYPGQNANIPEMALQYSDQILKNTQKDRTASWLDSAFTNFAAAQQGDYGLALALSGPNSTLRKNFDATLDSQIAKMQEYQTAVAASQIFNASQAFSYANANRSNVSDYTWGLSYGNALMNDDLFNREFTIAELGLNSGQAINLTFNQLSTQLANVDVAQNIATNYATSKYYNYAGPADTSIANVALLGANQLKDANGKKLLDYDYQAAQPGYYAAKDFQNAVESVKEAAIYAGTYLATVNMNNQLLRNAYLSPNLNLAVLDPVAEAKKVTDDYQVIQQDVITQKLYDQYIATTPENQIKFQDFASFNNDSEVQRSSKELNYEKLAKVVAPSAAIATLPLLTLAGAAPVVGLGLVSSAFSLYQGAGMKAQALEMQRIDIDSRRNAIVQSYQESGAAPEKIKQLEADLKLQVDTLNKQGNLMLANSAVAALTSGGGLLTSLAGKATAATTANLLANSGQLLTRTGQLGGIVLNSYNTVNSSLAAYNAFASSKKFGDTAFKEGAFNTLGAFVAASGVAGNSFGLFGPTVLTNKIDFVLDAMNVLAGAAVDVRQVAQACYGSSGAFSEQDCVNAWIGLALSAGQNVAQISSSYKNYQAHKITVAAEKTALQVADLQKQINAVDGQLAVLNGLSNEAPSKAKSYLFKQRHLKELTAQRQALQEQIVKLDPNAQIQNKLAATSVDPAEYAARGRSIVGEIRTLAQEASANNKKTAAYFNRKATDIDYDIKQIGTLRAQIDSIDAEVTSRGVFLSDTELSRLQNQRQELVQKLKTSADRLNEIESLQKLNASLVTQVEANQALSKVNDLLAIDSQKKAFVESFAPSEKTVQEQITTLIQNEQAPRLLSSPEENLSSLAVLESSLSKLSALRQEKQALVNGDGAVDPVNLARLTALETEIASLEKIADNLSNQNRSLWQKAAYLLRPKASRQAYHSALDLSRQIDSLQSKLQAQNISPDVQKALQAELVQAKRQLVDQKYILAEAVAHPSQNQIQKIANLINNWQSNRRIAGLKQAARKLGTANLELVNQISQKQSEINQLREQGVLNEVETKKVKALEAEIANLTQTARNYLKGSNPFIRVDQTGEFTRYIVEDAGRKAGIKQEQLDILNQELTFFESMQRELTGRADFKIYSGTNTFRDQDIFLLAELEAIGIGSRGSVFGALPGMGKTDVVMPFNVLLKQRLTKATQFVVFPEAKLMKPWVSDNDFTPNQAFIDQVEKRFGVGSVLIVRPNDQNIDPAAIAQAKFVITTKEVAFDLQNASSQIGLALRQKWRQSYVHADEVDWTFNPNENYKISGRQVALTDKPEFALYAAAQRKVLGIDERGQSLAQDQVGSPTLRGLVESLEQTGLIPSAITRTNDGKGGRFADVAVEKQVLTEWLSTWSGQEKIADLDMNADIAVIRGKIDAFLSTDSDSDIHQRRAELAMINETVNFLSRVPREDYGLSTNTVVRDGSEEIIKSIAPNDQNRETGRSYSAVAEALLYNSVGARTQKAAEQIDINRLTVGEEGSEINYALLMLESQGFSLYTGTPETVAQLYKMAYGIELKVFTDSALDSAIERFKNSNSTLFTDLAAQIQARLNEGRDQVFVNMIAGRKSNQAALADLVAAVSNVEGSQLYQKLFLVGASGNFTEYDLVAGQLNRVSDFVDSNALNLRTKELNVANQRFIKFYEYGAHVGVDTANDVNLSRAVGLCSNCDATTFAQGINRVRVQVITDPDNPAQKKVIAAPMDIVWLDAPANRTDLSVDDFVSTIMHRQTVNQALAEVAFKETLLKNSLEATFVELIDLARNGKKGFLGIEIYRANPDLVAQLESAQQKWKETSQMNYLLSTDDLTAQAKLEKTALQVATTYEQLNRLLAGSGEPAKLLARRADGALGEKRIALGFTSDDQYQPLGRTPSYRQIVELINQSSKHLDDVDIAFTDRSSTAEVIRQQFAQENQRQQAEADQANRVSEADQADQVDRAAQVDPDSTGQAAKVTDQTAVVRQNNQDQQAAQQTNQQAAQQAVVTTVRVKVPNLLMRFNNLWYGAVNEAQLLEENANLVATQVETIKANYQDQLQNLQTQLALIDSEVDKAQLEKQIASVNNQLNDQATIQALAEEKTIASLAEQYRSGGLRRLLPADLEKAGGLSTKNLGLVAEAAVSAWQNFSQNRELKKALVKEDGFSAALQNTVLSELNQQNLVDLQNKINNVGDVRGSFNELLWTHNTPFSSLAAIFQSGLISSLTAEGRAYIQTENITEEEFWKRFNQQPDLRKYGKYVKRGFNARYGLSSDFGDIKFVFRPGFEHNKRGYNENLGITNEPYISDFFSLNRALFKNKYTSLRNNAEFNLAGFLRAIAQSYGFNRHLSTDLTEGYNPGLGVLQRPYVNPQMQIAGAITLDDVQAILVPEHLYNQVIELAKKNGFDLNRIIKVKTGDRENYYAYDRSDVRKNSPAIKSQAIADGVMRPNRIGRITGSSVTMVTAKKAFEKEQQAYLQIMLDLELSKATQTNDLSNEFLFNLMIEGLKKQTVKIGEQSFSVKQLFEEDAGVWEKYSVEESTEMVFRQFSKYFAQNLNEEQKEFFTLLISLHDLGKSMERTQKLPDHSVTTAIAKQILEKLNYSTQEINKFIALIEQDFLGDYFKNTASLNETYEKIKSQAKKYNLSLRDYFSALYIFYMSDAGSYTRDAGGFISLEGRVFDQNALNGGQLLLNNVNVDKLKQLEALINSSNSSKAVFSSLCSDCNQVRLDTQAGVEKANALMQEAEALLVQVGEAETAGDLKQAHTLTQQAADKKQAALKQLNDTRLQVVNSHGMQNQCVQLYLNAWVDTKEAEIRQKPTDVNRAIASVYKATLIAKQILASKQMTIVTKPGFLSIGRQTETLDLTPQEISDVNDLLEGNQATAIVGLKQMAEFAENDGKLDRKKLIGGVLQGIKNAISRRFSFFTFFDQARILKTDASVVLKRGFTQNFNQEKRNSKLNSYITSVLDLDKKMNLIPLSQEISLNSTDHIQGNWQRSKEEVLEEIGDILNAEHYNTRFLSTDDEMVRDIQTFVDQLADLINRERTEAGKELLPKAKVYVSLNQGLNAFALPDGSLVVNQGLINALETKDQLFAILVHEFSHFEDNFLNWNEMLSELTSGRAQEYKADRTSLLRLGRLGYQPKAFQGAAEIIGSYSDNRTAKKSFWGNRGVQLFNMSKFKIISDLEHGSLFNRSINLEVAFNFQELGIAENIRPTEMPSSWKKATNFGFIYELSNSKKNAAWERLFSTANPSIKKQYYENFVPSFRKRVSNAKDYINNSSKKSIGFWQKLYNTILFQQTLGIIDQEFKKFDYLLRDLHVNTDQLKEMKLLWISSYSSIDRFSDTYNQADLFFKAFDFNFLFDYDKLYFSISPLFFKIRNLVNKLQPSDADLNSQYYEELLNKDLWSSLFEKNKPALVLKPESILDFQLSNRRNFLKNKNLRKTISDLFDDVEREFPLINQFSDGLNLGKQVYKSSISLHLYSLSIDLQDRLINEIRLNDLEPEPYLDRLINLMLQNPNWSKDQILEYSNNNFKYSGLKKREEYFNYIKKKLNLNEERNDDTDVYIDLSAYKGVSKLNQSEQEIKIQEFNQKILAIFTKNKLNAKFKVDTLSEFLNDSFLELEDRVFLNNLLVKFALNENNFKQIFSGETDIKSNSFILAQYFIFTFFKNSFLLSDFDDQTNIDQAFLDLNKQLQDQYLDYLKSLIYEKEWQVLAEYFEEIIRACKNTSLSNRNFSLLSNFAIIQELQNYLNNLNISDINQDISGFRPGIHFAPETINFSVSTQLRWFFELANGRHASAINRIAGEEYYFGTNEVEANLLKPLIIYELKFVEEKSKNLQGVDLYNFLEKNFPPLQTKNQILEEIATKLFQELPFNEAYDFLKQSLENGHNHYTHFFLENHVKTLEEYKIISEDQSLNQSLGSEQKSLDRTVAVDTLVSNYITNMNETDLLEFFEASIKGDHEKVKYYLAKYYSSLLTYDREFGSLQAISRLASYSIGKKTSIFVDENGNLYGPGLTSFLTFEEFVASFYNLSKLEKTAFIAKLLSEKLLLNEDNHLKIATFLTDQLEDSEELNLKPLLKNIISSTLSQVEGSTRIELGISRALADSFLQGNPRAVSNNYAVERIISENLPSDGAEDYREKVRKMLTNLFNQDKNVAINKNSNYQFVFDLNVQFENIALRSIEKFGIKREAIQNSRDSGKIQTGQFIVELAKSLGSLGVRFLQVFGQYFDLPKELQQEFLSVYDNASNLYMANLFQSAETAIDSLQNPANAASQEEIDYNLAQAKQLKELLPNIRIIKKIGGGSINTTYLVEIRNPMSDEITLKVLKISNPNVIIDVAETRTLVESVVNDLQKLDKRNKKNYEVVQRLINTLEQWNTEDIQDKNFLSNDLLFNQLYPYQSRFGFTFNTSNKHEIYNRWIKIEDYVEGDTLKNLIANFENELISENHHANIQDNEKAKHIEELISDIVADYVRHLNHPVTLADGKTAYILHSDLHIGNIMANQTLSDVSVIDRSYYLVLSQEEVDLIKILFSNQQTDFHKFVNLTNYLLSSNQVEKSGIFNYWKAYASYLRVALKEKFLKHNTENNAHVSFFNAMMQETDRLKLEFPLNLRLFVKNMAAIDRMLLRIGNDHLSDYINGTEKTIYDGKTFLESVGLDAASLESFEINNDNLGSEKIFQNSLYKNLKNQIVFNFSSSFLYT